MRAGAPNQAAYFSICIHILICSFLFLTSFPASLLYACRRLFCGFTHWSHTLYMICGSVWDASPILGVVGMLSCQLLVLSRLPFCKLIIDFHHLFVDQNNRPPSQHRLPVLKTAKEEQAIRTVGDNSSKPVQQIETTTTSRRKITTTTTQHNNESPTNYDEAKRWTPCREDPSRDTGRTYHTSGYPGTTACCESEELGIEGRVRVHRRRALTAGVVCGVETLSAYRDVVGLFSRSAWHNVFGGGARSEREALGAACLHRS